MLDDGAERSSACWASAPGQAHHPFADIRDDLVLAVNLIAYCRELLAEALNVYLQATSNRLNTVATRLTVLASIFVPLTLITGFFGRTSAGWSTTSTRSRPSWSSASAASSSPGGAIWSGAATGGLPEQQRPVEFGAAPTPDRGRLRQRRKTLGAETMAVDLTQVAHVDTQPGELPATMAAWVIRQEREGEPVDAFQVEEIEVPEPGAFEVIVRVMAAGVNFNNVWAALGKPVSVFRYHPDEDHHIGGSDASGHRVEGRPGRDALEAGRRGRHPLQPGLLRGPRGPRPRPARRALPADLGLRDELGLVRAVHEGAGPAAHPQAGEPRVGGGGLLRADLLHRLPHAASTACGSSPATAC